MNGGEPITKCPVCRYDLTGLPKNHRCPECGFEYDETMRVWQSGVAHARGFVLSALACRVLAAMEALRFVGGVLDPKAEVRETICHLLLAVVMIIVVAKLRTARSLILLAPYGFWYKLPIGRMRFVPWRAIRFDSPQTAPKRVSRRWRKNLTLPAGLVSDSDREHFYYQMYDRWDTCLRSGRIGASQY